MSRAGLILSLLFLASVAMAQAPLPAVSPQQPMNLAPLPPQPPAPVAAINPTLVNHLKAWEQKHKQVQNLYAKCDLVKRNLLARKEKSYTGIVMCMKPNLAWMKNEAAGNPADYEAYICDGKSVFHYEGDRKLVTEHRIPKNNPNGVGDNLLLEFMSGAMTANDVIQRFDLALEKEEEHYVHIRVKPRLPKDLQEFESMLIVLFGPNVKGREYLPAVVVTRSNNGQNEEQWTFKDSQVNLNKMAPTNFQYVKPPAGWDVKAAPAAGMPIPPDPKVARPATPGK